MKMTQKEYTQMTTKVSPSAKSAKNLPMAFLFGGAFCVIGQFLYNFFEKHGLEIQSARAAVSISLVALSALLTAFQLYNTLAKYGGAGTLVPITGFANSVVAPAIEFRSEGHITGIGPKMFIIAGPVLLFGITASVIYGLVLWIFKLY